MKKYILALALLLAANPAYADITIGLAGSFTGENAFLGEQMRHGAEQAVADINAAGGIDGQKIVLREMDDACDPKQAVTVANKMASEGIEFVVGHACSGASIPAARVYNDEGIFMITPVSSNPALTDAGYTTIFRTYGRDDQQGKFIADYILSHFKGEKIALVNDKSAWGRGIVDVIQAELHKNGMHETLFESFNAGDRDFSSLVTLFKQNDIRLAFIAGYSTETGLIVRQLAEQKAHVQVIGGDAIFTNQFWAVTGPTGDGVLMSANADERKRPEAAAAVAALRKAGYEPEGYTLNAYAAVQVVAEGIKRAGQDPTKVAAALRAAPVKTVIGMLSFDSKGDIEHPDFSMYRWHNGTYAETGP
ncbi:MAG: branched-chain amino acid ABC transporter substrate-binding protein [Alphaproteobacteria bacterium]|nr:branched-chain amino acid ABC transporter substrate-binding protein [Alphaproteobacteria bacterium]